MDGFSSTFFLQIDFSVQIVFTSPILALGGSGMLLFVPPSNAAAVFLDEAGAAGPGDEMSQPVAQRALVGEGVHDRLFMLVCNMNVG